MSGSNDDLLHDVLQKVRKNPDLASESPKTTWSFVWPCLSPEEAAKQAAKLAEFFEEEVERLEEEAA